MPCDYSKYPADWKQIGARIRARAKNRCEWCGIPNYAVGHRLEDGSWRPTGGNQAHDAAANGELSYKEARELASHCNEVEDGPRYVVIVLTIAHLDHDVTNNQDGNLRALCNRCHLNHDAKHHAANAKATRERKIGQGVLV